MLFNKKSMLTMFATAALLSTSALGGVNAFAADSTDNGGAQHDGNDQRIGSIDDNDVTTTKGGLPNTSKTDGSLNKDGSVSQNGTVAGNSDAHIRVVKGYLVLESVPSLGFSDVAQSNDHDNTSDNVVDHNTVLNSDSYFKANNKPETLNVLDARSSDGSQAKNGGYNVNASLGAFSQYDNGGNTGTAAQNPFTLNLDGQIQSSDKGADATPSNVSLKSVNGLKDGQTPTGNSSTILSSSQIGGGSTSVTFDHGSSLTVPKGTDSGNYAAPITWTLNPSADGSTINNGTQSNPGK